MRLRSLGLKAFGPFTGRILEFNSSTPGLHIIYGPNEAGKSSSLRALKALLYGFPPQTPDNFLHSYEQLLVSGCLENSNGQQLVFQRRKRRLGDLLDEAGNPLPANALLPFLQGMEPEIFESLYGIDHEALVCGGEEILAQKGEVGQALFAAGSGISSLQKVIDQLEQEASGLFKATGHLPEINKAIKRFKELQKAARAAALSCKEWKEQRQALQGAEEERTRLERERDLKNTELHRLERLAQAIPELALHKSYREQLQALGEVVVLPPDFAEKHRRVDLEIREAGLRWQQDSDRLEKLKARRQALSFNRDLILRADKLDEFHQRLGEYRKALKDRPEREGMRIGLRREAAHLLQQVRPDLTLEELEPLRPVLGRKKSVLRLSTDYEAINERLLQAERRVNTAAQDLQEAMLGLAATPELPDGQKLLLAVKLAQRSGDLDTLLDNTRYQVEQGRKECLTELQRLGRWSGELQALMELPLPMAETVQQFDLRFSELDNARRGLEKERRESERELDTVRAEIKKGAYTGEIPSEEALLHAREQREHGWQLLLRQWLDHQDVTAERLAYAPDRPLAEVYHGYVHEADAIADRLRREADRVTMAAALRAQMETLQQKLVDGAQRAAALDQQKQELAAAWDGIWQPLFIAPLSPKEMSGWLTAIDKLRFKVTEILKKEQEIDRDIQRRQTLRQAVDQELQLLNQQKIPSREALGPLVVFAETVLESLTRRQTERRNLTERQEMAEKNVRQAEAELTAAQEALARWRELWRQALSGLGLTGDVSTFEALDLLDLLQGCFDKVKEAADLQKRIDGIDRDARKLEDEVKTLLRQVAPDLLALPLDQAIVQARLLLGQSQRDLNLYDKLSEDIDSLQTELAATDKTLQSAREQMEEILRTAKCDQPDQLATVIGTFAAYQRLQEKISDTEANLAKIGAGVDLAEIVSQAGQVNADELPGRIDLQRRDIAQRLHPEINRISQLIGEQGSRLAAMDGSARAAEAAEEMEQELARMRRLADRYTLVKVAAKVLQLEIERYREEHQDPVLAIGSRYFRQLTLGSFTGLRTDLDDKGAPVLVGIRPDEIRVPVQGMSSGTRDQLYLALRLATLEYRLKAHEPIPFIVDDILINFDDARSRATLEALAALSAKNQIILFTHHQRIAEEAQALAEKDRVVIHRL